MSKLKTIKNYHDLEIHRSQLISVNETCLVLLFPFFTEGKPIAGLVPNDVGPVRYAMTSLRKYFDRYINTKEKVTHILDVIMRERIEIYEHLVAQEKVIYFDEWGVLSRTEQLKDVDPSEDNSDN